MDRRPLVSIGLPVHNGMPYLRVAIESLLSQDYPHIEIVIADNASTDGTSDCCRALAEADSRVRYMRHDANIGPARNFEYVLESARGELFMWAADDDKWNPQYVSQLVRAIEGRADAVLATPTVIHMASDGTLCNEPPDRPAPGISKRANLRQLYDDHAATWIYGLWRTRWLRRHFAEYHGYPLWGADVLWLADVCLRFMVTGCQDAVIFKRRRRSSYAPKSARAQVVFWAYMLWHISRIAWRRSQGLPERSLTLLLSWRYVYQLCIRRSHPLRTAWRVVRMLSFAALTSLPLGIAYALRRLARRPLPATLS